MRSRVVLASLALVCAATNVAKADIGLNESRGLDQNCFGAESQHEQFISPTTGTVVIVIHNSGNSGSWTVLRQGSTSGTTIADTGTALIGATRRDDGSVSEGGTYWLSQSSAWGSCGSQTMEIWGVSFSSPTHNQVVTTTNPTLSGRAPSGTNLTIREGGTTICTATANGSHQWSCNVGSALSQGSHTFTAETSFNGYTLTSTRTFTVNSFTSVSITAPANGTQHVGLGAAPTTATGNVEAGASVSVTVDGTLRCSIPGSSTGGGSWSCGLPALANGNHTISVTANDGVNTANASSTFYVRTTTSVTITTPANNAVLLAFPTWAGTRQNQASLTVRVNGTTMCTVAATTPINTVAGWSCTGGTLADGTYTVVVDAVEGTMSATASASFRLDRGTSVAITAPTAMQMVTDATPTITGTGENGATIAVLVDGTQLGTATVSGGTWSFTPSANLTDGNHTITANATDDVGFTASATRTFRVNTGTSIAISAPTAGAVLTAEPMYEGTAEPGVSVTVTEGSATLCTTMAHMTTGAWSCAGPLLADGGHNIVATANDGTFTATATRAFSLDRVTTVTITAPSGQVVTSTPVVTGTGENGASVVVTLNGMPLSPVTVSGGTYTRALGTLADGAYTLSVTATDAVGNTATATGSFTVNTGTTLSISAPTAGAVLTNEPVYAGTAENGVTVTVREGVSTLCVATAHMTTGAWSCSGPSLPDGAHTIEATANDGTFTATATRAFSLDRATTVTITAPTGQVTTAMPTATGAGENGASVAVTLDGVLLGAVTVAGGVWSRPLGVLTDGPHTVSVLATDAVGNTATATQSFTVNTGTSITISNPDDGETVSAVPTYQGTAEPSGAITVLIDGAPVCTTTAHAVTGAWACSGGALADGAHALTARVFDGTFTEEVMITFTLDRMTNVAILTPVGQTTDATPVVSGTAEPNAMVMLSIDGSLVTTVTATAAGTWSYELPATLADGAHTASVVSTDLLGNMGTDLVSFTVNTGTSIDLVSPVHDSVLAAMPTFGGTAERGATVTVRTGVTVLCTTTAHLVTGEFACTAAMLPAGTYPVVATVDDGTFSATDGATFTLDLSTFVTITAPATTVSTATPTIGGNAEPFAQVRLELDGNLLTTVTTSAGGTWSYALTVPLSEGAHSVHAVATDAVLNTAQDTRAFTVNTGTSITLVTPNEGLLTATQPAFSGIAERAVMVTVRSGAMVLCTTTASPITGEFTCNGIALADGTYTITATADDGLFTATDSSTFTLDRVTTVAITEPTAATTSTPTIRGTGEPGASVMLRIDGSLVATVTVLGDGTWSHVLAAPLADGSHTAVANATDAALNTASDTRTFTVNTGTTVDLVTPANGASLATIPQATGTAERGVTVIVSIGGSPVCTTTADNGTGAFACALGALADGTYTVTARADDGTFEATDSATFTLDRATTVSFTSPSGTVTAQPTVVTGTGEPGAMVAITLDGVSLGTATVTPAGTFSIAIVGSIVEGPHSLAGTATDALGNTANAAQAFTLNSGTSVDLLSPVAGAQLTAEPTYSGTGEVGATITVERGASTLCTTTVNGAGAWSCTGPILPEGRIDVVARANDGLHTATDASHFFLDRMTHVTITAPTGTVLTRRPTIQGTTEAFAMIAITLDGAPLVTVSATSAGTFAFPLAVDLADGAHDVYVFATDALGNTASDEVSFTVNTGTSVEILAPLGDTTVRPFTTVSGTAEAGASVSLAIDGTSVCTTTAGANGAWSCTITALPDGPHTLTATANDGTFQAVRALSLTVDGVTTVTITAPTGATGNPLPTIRGNAEVSASVVVRVDGIELGTVVAGLDGAYAFVPTMAFTHGMHDISVTATDAVGNTASATGSFSVDTSIPAIDLTSPVDESVIREIRPSIVGTATPGALVMISIDAGAIVTVTTDALGIFRLDLTSDLAVGPHTVIAATMNSVGTRAEARADFTIDTSVPVIVILTPVNGAAIADATPLVTGTAESGTTVRVAIDGIDVSDLPGAPTWEMLVPYALPDGMHTVVATATDLAGNVGTASTTFRVDTTTTVTITQPADGAAIGAARPTIVGTAEPMAEITLSVDGVEVATLTADATGAFSHALGTDLADGAHTVSAHAVDLLGNEATTTNDFTVDPALRDSDGDGISDTDERPNGMDVDTDDDGHPNHLDPDDDGDGIPTAMERPNAMDVDSDGDSSPNHLDPDDDGDGVPTRTEAPGGVQRDTDTDGLPDHRDADDDGDSIPTADERPDGADTDFDGDGAPNHLDADDDDDDVPTLVERMDGAVHGHDVDGDGAPNHLDTDADGDHLDDGTDGVEDDDHDGVPNYLQASVGFAGGAGCSASPGRGGTGFAALVIVLLALAVRRRRSVALAALLLVPSVTFAQAANVDVPTRAETVYDGFVVRSPQVSGHMRFGARLDLDYANDPLVIEAVQGSSGSELASVVRHHARVRLLGSLGLTSRLMIFVGLPVHLVMSGDGADELAGFPAADGPGLGDPSVGARVRLYGDDDAIFQLGVQATLFVPLAHLAFDSHYSGNEGFSASVDLLTRVHTAPLDVLVTVGGDARGNERFGNVDVGSQLRFGAGVLVPLAQDKLVVSGELHGSFALGDFGARESTAVGVLAGARYTLNDGLSIGANVGTGLTRGLGMPDVHAGLMVGFDQPDPPPPPPDTDADDDGIDDEHDQCPDRAEDRDGRGDEDGCPDLDDDEDGVPDAADGAPTIAEDRDGFDDHDGVPDPDNDHDGILDDVDRCPSSAEDRDEIEDEDGCPEDDVDHDQVSDQRDHCPFTPGVDDPRYPDCRGCPALACMREDGSIEIHQRIEFETGNDRILEESFPVLEAVIQILRDNAHVQRVRIEGHTDNTGNERRNLELSRTRASSVKRWLVEHGVGAERLEAFGCGQNVALRMNDTVEGRQANRRVEFIVVDPPPPGRGHVISDRCVAAQ